MILVETKQSLQKRSEIQIQSLKKAAIFDSSFEETIKLIQDMLSELNGAAEDIDRFNAIAMKLEKEVSMLRKKCKRN